MAGSAWGSGLGRSDDRPDICPAGASSRRRAAGPWIPASARSH